MKSALTIIGTRPEAIKLIPVISALKKNAYFKSKICITNQHTDLLDSFFLSSEIKVDYQLENFVNKGNLPQNTAQILTQLSPILEDEKPDIVLVQGDTTSAFAAALAAFYARIPVVHIEAGLRTGDMYSPWPEEIHRCLIDKLATYFFAPTHEARDILISEGLSSNNIWVVGNTSIDAIRLALAAASPITRFKEKIILVTVHRRENHGEPLREICQALLALVEQFSGIRILFLLHPNPAIHRPVSTMLGGINNIDLIEPLNHLSFVQLLNQCIFVITDSGGIQEEVSFVGKPVLVVRNKTERPENINAGTAWLVGTKSVDIISCCKELIGNPETLEGMSKVHFSYGDGHAAERIVKILEEKLKEKLL